MKTITVMGTTALLAVGMAAPAQAAAPQGASVHRFADASVVGEAWSTLNTNAAGARMSIHTRELTPGNGVTVWWVIFNQPGECEHGSGAAACGAADLLVFGGKPSVQSSVLYAAGNYVGGTGKATFSGHLTTGDDDAALFGPGLVNPLGAEVHLVVRDHGPKDGRANDEIHTFGTCNGGDCTDVQFAIHLQ